jgi:hypothetical protein
VTTTLRVELMPNADKAGYYSAWLADEDMVCLVRSSRTPIYDAARALLAAAWAPDTLMTATHHGARQDCWLPTRIGVLAKWTINEGEKTNIRRAKYTPRTEWPEKVLQTGKE